MTLSLAPILQALRGVEHDLEAYLAASGLHAGRQPASTSLFDELDTNHDGVVDRKEFASRVYEQRNARPVP